MVTIEEKAKRYDEAIKALRSLFAEQAIKHCDRVYIKDITNIFSELKESEDERIRKELINYFIKGKEYLSLCSFSKEEILAWLEKQGEKNLAFIEKGKWYVCIRTSYKPNGKDFIEGKIYYAKEDYKIIGECGEVDIATDNPEEFFRSATEEETNDIIKYFVNEQKPAWSEEDEDILNTIINHFKVDIECTDEDDVIRWLKSLRPQNTWKPSDEQIEALESATENCAYSEYQDCLRELIKQLKKLREDKQESNRRTTAIL